MEKKARKREKEGGLKEQKKNKKKKRANKVADLDSSTFSLALPLWQLSTTTKTTNQKFFFCLFFLFRVSHERSAAFSLWRLSEDKVELELNVRMVKECLSSKKKKV